MHDYEGCVVSLLNVCKGIGKKLVNRCAYTPLWKTAVEEMCIDPRPHADPELAQFLPPTEGRHRERHVDTMLCFTKTDRLFVQYLGKYVATVCISSVLRVTKQLAHKMRVAHITDKSC